MLQRSSAHPTPGLLRPLGVALLLVSANVAAQELPRTADGKPDLNGIWQVMNTANWNLEAHSATQGATEILGAIGAVPPGPSVVKGGHIPYLPEAKAQKEQNFQNRRTEDPEAKCYMPGLPRATYMPYPFQIVQSDGDLMMVYQFAGAVRTINMSNHQPAPVDSWMGWSNGHWEGDTLVIEVTGLNANWLDRSGNFASEQRRVIERYTMLNPYVISYEATIEDPTVFSEPWTLSMPLYKHVEEEARLLDFKCAEFAEELLYGHLSKDAAARSNAAGEQP
jgi:hypothetical protein